MLICFLKQCAIKSIIYLNEPSSLTFSSSATKNTYNLYPKKNEKIQISNTIGLINPLKLVASSNYPNQVDRTMRTFINHTDSFLSFENPFRAHFTSLHQFSYIPCEKNTSCHSFSFPLTRICSCCGFEKIELSSFHITVISIPFRFRVAHNFFISFHFTNPPRKVKSEKM